MSGGHKTWGFPFRSLICWFWQPQVLLTLSYYKIYISCKSLMKKVEKNVYI